MIVNASLRCSSAELGRRQDISQSASRREIVLRLDEPCAVVAVSSANSSSSTDSATATETSSFEAQDDFNETSAVAFVGGYSSDWSMLVASGILVEDDDDDGDDEDDRGGAAEGAYLFLNATSDFVTDLSAAANPLVAVENLPQSFPGTLCEGWVL